MKNTDLSTYTKDNFKSLPRGLVRKDTHGAFSSLLVHTPEPLRPSRRRSLYGAKRTITMAHNLPTSMKTYHRTGTHIQLRSGRAPASAPPRATSPAEGRRGESGALLTSAAATAANNLDQRRSFNLFLMHITKGLRESRMNTDSVIQHLLRETSLDGDTEPLCHLAHVGA